MASEAPTVAVGRIRAPLIERVRGTFDATLNALIVAGADSLNL